MEYKYDEESVNALMKWAEHAQLPKELQLSEAEKIVKLIRIMRFDIVYICHYVLSKIHNLFGLT